MPSHIQTRYVETAQDGIIHHSAFIPYFEVARIEFLQNLGYDIREMEKEKKYCIVAELSIRYKKPLFSLESIEVEVFCTQLSKVRFSFGHRVIRNGELIAEGTTVHCFVNESFSPIPIPYDMIESLKKNLIMGPSTNARSSKK